MTRAHDGPPPELYRQIVESTEEGVWLIDAAAATRFVNPKMARMLGYTEAEMLGRPLFDFMDDAGRALSTRNLERRREGIAEPHEFVFRRKDGSELQASLVTNPILEGGAYAGALAMVSDIGERKRAEAEHQISEERFRSLFEHSPNILWEEDATLLKPHLDALRAGGVTDLRAYFAANPDEVGHCFSLIRVLDVNQASVVQYEARDKAELIASLHLILTPESIPVLVEEIIALAEGAMIFEAETTDQSLTGRRNDILLKTLVAPGSEHTWSRVYVSIVDITARKQAEARVRKLASFPELAPNAVLALAADGAITYANPAFEDIARRFGAAPAALLPPQTPTLVREALATGEGRPVETKHGDRTLAWTFHPIVAQATVHCYAVDITERLLLEEQLRQSQKMDAIGHLAGGIAHDFNNLLTVVSGNTSLLQRDRATPEMRTQLLRQIEMATDRAATLVRQLLAFSRQQVLQVREIDLNDVVTSMATMFERVVGEDVAVTLELSPVPLVTRADASMLDQVLMNLVVNARDAMPDGGTLVLATSERVVREPTHDVPAGRYACLRVTDTGAGIAPAHLARVFEPFFTTKAPGTGTGLGLATVFGIAKQHGGTAMIASEIGRGTTVSVLVPIAATVTAAAAAAPAVVGGVVDGAIAHGNEAILVVEDEVAVGQLVQRVLEMHGYRVAVVGSGVEALARVERAGAAFDLVVTDLVMPGGISGRELAERLRDRLPALAVIFMSGYAGELAGRGLELREGKNFLQKPFTPAALLSSIRGELDRQGELARPRTS